MFYAKFGHGNNPFYSRFAKKVQICPTLVKCYASVTTLQVIKNGSMVKNRRAKGKNATVLESELSPAELWLTFGYMNFCLSEHAEGMISSLLRSTLVWYGNMHEVSYWVKYHSSLQLITNNKTRPLSNSSFACTTHL